MKFFKDKATKADTKDIIAEAGMELNDNELEMVTGGMGDTFNNDGFLNALQKTLELEKQRAFDKARNKHR